MKAALLFLVLLAIPIVSAEVIVNEVAVDPDGADDITMPGGEWVELYNNGDSSIDVNGWVLYDSKDTNELYIKSTNVEGGLVISPGGFLVVYRNKDSDFNLNNDGDSVRLYDGYPVSNSSLKSSMIYTSKSTCLCLISGEWKDCSPTPGAANQAAPPPPSEQEPESNNSETNDKNTTDEEKPQEVKDKVLIEIDAPEEVSASKEFTSKIKLTNKFSIDQTVQVYTYVYVGSKCVSDGGWSADPREVSIGAGQTKELEFKDLVKEGTAEGSYSFKVKVKMGEKVYEATKALKVVASSEAPESADEELEPDSVSLDEKTPSTDESKERDSGKAITGAVVYSDKNKPSLTIPLVILGVVLAIVVVMLLLQLKK